MSGAAFHRRSRPAGVLRSPPCGDLLGGPDPAYMEGNMRASSTTDCGKPFHRTGVPSANMLRRAAMPHTDPLIQIRTLAN